MNHKGPYLWQSSKTLLIDDISFSHCVDSKLGIHIDDLEWISLVQKALLGEQVAVGSAHSFTRVTRDLICRVEIG